MPTDVPVGTANQPLHVTIVRPTSGSTTSETLGAAATASATSEAATNSGTPSDALDTAATSLGKTLVTQTGLTVQVDLVNSDAEALAALCNSANGAVTAAWLNGIGYAAAYAQGCGTAGAEVERGSLASATNGDQARIYVNPGSKIASVTDLVNKTFCRISVTDLYSWLVPLIMMNAGGFTSTGDLQAIRDYADPSQMIAATLDGTCDAMGIAGSVFDDTASDNARSTLTLLQKSSTIPFAVLVYPPQVLSDVQDKVTGAFVALGTGADAASVKPLLNQDQIAAATDADFAGLRAFIDKAGIDLAQAGS